MIKFIIKVCILSLCMVFFTSCSSEKMDFGVEENGFYINEYFNFKIEKPLYWQFMLKRFQEPERLTNKEKLKSLNSFANKMFSRDFNKNDSQNNNMDFKERYKKMIENQPRYAKINKLKSHSLLTMIDDMHNNGNIDFYIINNKLDGYKCKNLNDLNKMYKKMVLKRTYSIITTTKEMMIGNQKFAYIDIANGNQNTVYISKIIKDFILQIKFSYNDIDELRRSLEILDNIEFQI